MRYCSAASYFPLTSQIQHIRDGVERALTLFIIFISYCITLKISTLFLTKIILIICHIIESIDILEKNRLVTDGIKFFF